MLATDSNKRYQSYLNIKPMLFPALDCCLNFVGLPAAGKNLQRKSGYSLPPLHERVWPCMVQLHATTLRAHLGTQSSKLLDTRLAYALGAAYTRARDMPCYVKPCGSMHNM